MTEDVPFDCGIITGYLGGLAASTKVFFFEFSFGMNSGLLSCESSEKGISSSSFGPLTCLFCTEPLNDVVDYGVTGFLASTFLTKS